MRIYIFCLIAAILFLLPTLSYQLDWDVARSSFMWVLNIPATGLGYMGVFFHEIGHTLARWLFGVPAIPTFDLTHGGGMTYDFPRSMLLQGLIYVAFAAGGLWLYRHHYYLHVVILALFTAIHAALGMTAGHDIFMLYMGHGAEILIGCFCLLRATLSPEFRVGVERVIHLVFGFFILGKNIMENILLMTDDVHRMVYEGQKGGHGFGDFSRIADHFSIRLETVAGLSLLFIALCAVATAWIVVRSGFRSQSR